MEPQSLLETACPPPNVKDFFFFKFSVQTIFTVSPGSRGPGSRQAGGDEDTQKLSDGVVYFLVPSGLAHELSEFG